VAGKAGSVSAAEAGGGLGVTAASAVAAALAEGTRYAFEALEWQANSEALISQCQGLLRTELRK
jgi:hypothetical protein